MIQLDRQRILEALDELSRRLAQRGVTAELCLFGGAAMILAFQSRQITQKPHSAQDTVFRRSDP